MDVFQIPMREALQLDEEGFSGRGGWSMALGALEEDGTVQVFAIGPASAVQYLAEQIAARRQGRLPVPAA